MANESIPHIEEGGTTMQPARGLRGVTNEKPIPHKRPAPGSELQDDLQDESLAHKFRRKVLPSLMEETGARAQGVWIPSWFLAIILIPVCGGILWVVITLTQISRDQANIQTTIEYRLKEVETRNKLNDEHIRGIEETIARIDGAVSAQRRK